MKAPCLLLITGLIAGVSLGPLGYAAAPESIRLTDVVKSNGNGTIDFLKDATSAQLEQLRIDNNGALVVGVDVNESSNGSEKASTQAVTLGALSLTVLYSDGSSTIYDLNHGCCFTETQALVAAGSDVARLPYFTLLGESGSSRITANNQIQNDFDSTVKIQIDQPLFDTASGVEATSVVANIAWLDTNTSLGDPEAFYDYTNGFEDLAILSAADTQYIDQNAAGRDEAIAVVLTNPPEEVDPMAIATWSFFPSAGSYYLVGYEDLYPRKGDYDFNDLTVAYQLRYGLNSDGNVVTVLGTAYLLTRGAAYNHDWTLRIDLPDAVHSVYTCTTFLESSDEYQRQDCIPGGGATFIGDADMQIFSGTAVIFVDPENRTFTNTLAGQAFRLGPRSNFSLDFAEPLAADSIGPAPFDPYVFVRNTGQTIRLLQVDPRFKDEDGFPFGMLVPSDWRPPLEYRSISDVYSQFNAFVSSEGALEADWYLGWTEGQVAPVPAQSTWAW